MHIKTSIDLSSFVGPIQIVPPETNSDFSSYLRRIAWRGQLNRTSKSGRKAKSPFFVRGQGVVSGHPKAGS